MSVLVGVDRTSWCQSWLSLPNDVWETSAYWRHDTDMGSDSYWLKQICSLSEALYPDQYYNICMEFLHSFLWLHKETMLLDGVAKCWLSSLWLMCSHSTSSQQMQRAIQQFTSLSMWVTLIGHFRVPKNLTFKARLSAKPLIWKWFLIMMQIKLIFTTKVSHLASFWKWDFLELGNGLFNVLCVWDDYCHCYFL